MMPYVPPSYQKSAFNCPTCNAYANQKWSELHHVVDSRHMNAAEYKVALCTHCNKLSVWYQSNMSVY